MKKSAFTILEIVVVLTIFAVILGLGIGMYSSMTKSTTISESVGDLVSILKETQNLAKNNTLPKSETPYDKAQYIYYYVLEVKSMPTAPYGNINRYIYRKMNGTFDTTIVQQENDIKTKLFNNVSFRSTSRANECTYIMFENLTGKIMAASESTMPGVFDPGLLYANSVASCDIQVYLVDDESYSKLIYVNAKNGTFGIVGETK